MISDRLTGLVVILVAAGYMAAATGIQTSFLADPVGPKAFPMLVGGVSILCGLSMLLRPDPNPHWPAWRTAVKLLLSVAVLIAYAYLLKPLGFLLPTAACAAILSFQISPRPLAAAITGIGLSLVLFLLFKYALGLGLVALPTS